MQVDEAVLTDELKVEDWLDFGGINLFLCIYSHNLILIFIPLCTLIDQLTQLRDGCFVDLNNKILVGCSRMLISSELILHDSVDKVL